jgi:hypothetical protein
MLDQFICFPSSGTTLAYSSVWKSNPIPTI